jgi:hypothetical protein
MADLIYDSFKEYIGDGTIDLDGHTFKLMLCTSSYTPSSTHTQKSQVTNEVSGTGYTAGGATLQNVSWNRSGGTVTFDADNVTWANSTITARYGIIYDDDATNDELCVCLDFGEDKTSSNGNFTVNFHASGIFTLS